MQDFYHGNIVSLKGFLNEKFTVVSKKGKRCKGFYINVIKTDNTKYYYKKEYLKLVN